MTTSLMRSALRTIPLVLVASLAVIHPALAGTVTSGIAQVTTPATQVQSTFQFLGIIVAVIGVVWGALHFVRHRDWIGAAEGVLGAFFAAAIIGNAPALITAIGGTVP